MLQFGKTAYNMAVSMDKIVCIIHCVQKKNTHSRFLFFLGGKCFDYTKFSGYVCE